MSPRDKNDEWIVCRDLEAHEKRKENKDMASVCEEQISAAKYWLSGPTTNEVRLYWKFIKAASEAFMDRNTKKKRPLRKRPRLRRPEAG